MLGRHLVIFAKQPRLGRGKTRLAAHIGMVPAWRFQRNALSALVRRLGGTGRWTTWLAISPDRSGPWPKGVRITSQGSGDLGKRMAGAAQAMPPGPVVIVGSDIPGIMPDHIRRAFAALGRHDAVFGPAEDGGFWLVGLKRRPVFIAPFASVRWSSCHALADTVANFSRHSVAMLDMLEDVDDGEAYLRLRQKGALP